MRVGDLIMILRELNPDYDFTIDETGKIVIKDVMIVKKQPKLRIVKFEDEETP